MFPPYNATRSETFGWYQKIEGAQALGPAYELSAARRYDIQSVGVNRFCKDFAGGRGRVEKPAEQVTA
jgi:hypothetical protein